jgi:hypothetical protein
MRVGVYIDGYNLYYGGQELCGRGTPGWRWLDVRGLAESLINPSFWVGASVTRVVYCTAPIHGQANVSAAVDQDVYLKALRASGSADHIELGKYIEKVKVAPLAVRDPKGRPILVRSAWPIMVKHPRDRTCPTPGSWCRSPTARKRDQTSTSPLICCSTC